MVTLQKRGGYVIGESLLCICLQGTGNSSVSSTLIPLADEVRDATHETVSIYANDSHTPSTAHWLTGQIGEGGAVYRALHFTWQYIRDLDVWGR